MFKIIRRPDRAEGGVTPKELKLMEIHSELWIKRALRNDPINPDKIIPAIKELYKVSGLKEPKVIIVPSPLVMTVAGGLAAGLLKGQATRNAIRSAPDDATHVAIDGATRVAAHAATSDEINAAIRATTFDAIHGAIDDATRIATQIATRNVTDSATYIATRAATDSATRSATDIATRNATYDATDDATSDATNGAIRDATDIATRAATDSATRSATDIATRSATYSATRNATYDAIDAATYIATDNATYNATDIATRAATDSATRAATHIATHVAVHSGSHVDQLSNGWAQTIASLFTNDSDIIQSIMLEIKNWYYYYQGGNFWAGYDCYLSATRDILGLRLPINTKYAAWEQCAIEGSFRFMHKDFCMVSDFPVYIKQDDRNRPHCDTGPSHLWRDGWALYHIHGVGLNPEQYYIIDHPEQITVAAILQENNAEVRRCMIDKYGATGEPAKGQAQFLLDSGAKKIHEDDYGILYRQEIPDDEPLVMVKVVNSTAEPDGTYKDYFIRVHPELRPIRRKYNGESVIGEPQELTAHAAVASSFGLRKEEYAPEVMS